MGLLAFGTEWHGRRETVGPTGCSYLDHTTRASAPNHGSTPGGWEIGENRQSLGCGPPPKVCVEATNREPNKVRVSLCLTLSCPVSVVVPNHNKNHPSVHQRLVATRSICSTRSPPKALIMSSPSCLGVGFHCTNTHKTTTGSSHTHTHKAAVNGVDLPRSTTTRSIGVFSRVEWAICLGTTPILTNVCMSHLSGNDRCRRLLKS